MKIYFNNAVFILMITTFGYTESSICKENEIFSSCGNYGSREKKHPEKGGNEMLFCPSGEKFTFCSNNDCQPTCEYPYGKENCNPICIPGCVCIEGLVRRESDNKCVPPSRCTPVPETPAFTTTTNGLKTTKYPKTTRRPPRPTRTTRRPPRPTRTTRRLPRPTSTTRLPPRPTRTTRRPPKPTRRTRRPPKPTRSTRHPPKPTRRTRRPPKPTRTTRRPPRPTTTTRSTPTGKCNDTHPGCCVTPRPDTREECKRRNEKYSNCSGHPGCQRTCKRPEGRKKGSKGCPSTCVPGCVCPRPLVRRELDMKCVPIKQCKIKEHGKGSIF